MTQSTQRQTSAAARSEEKRRHARSPARIRFTAEADGAAVEIVTTNLSAGGAYCSCPTRFPVMTRLAISMELPAGPVPFPAERLDLTAIVVRCEPDDASPASWNLALYFTDLPPAAVEKLTRFLRSQIH